MDPRRAMCRVVALLAAMSSGCGDGSSVTGGPSDAGAAAEVAAGDATAPSLRARPYRLVAPAAGGDGGGAPLVLYLHDYGSDGAAEVAWLGLRALVAAHGVVLAFPDGTPDAAGERFWNASDACCDFGRRGVDDLGYLGDVLDDVAARHRVDPARVFVVGHGNGAFMAYALACSSRRVAGIVDLGGADATRACADGPPVSVLRLHGDLDDLIGYDGGEVAGAAYPSARGTLARWSRRAGCGALVDTDARLDLDERVDGAETEVARPASCASGAVELWTLRGVGHYPALRADFAERAWSWLAANAPR